MRNSGDNRSARRLAHLTSAAKDAGVKLTHQRLEIFRELATSEEHPDAETVFRAVQRRVPTVSLDTVYRTIWKLHEQGLVSVLGPRRDGIRFDANLDRHHHFVCLGCGLVRDFESTELDRLPVPKSLDQFGVVVDAHVEVRGLCRTCARQRGERGRGTRAGVRKTSKARSSTSSAASGQREGSRKSTKSTKSSSARGRVDLGRRRGTRS